jgi:hypothetical protein
MAAAKADKTVWIVPLVLFALTCSLGIWGVWTAAQTESAARRAAALNRAGDKAQGIVSELRADYLPAKFLQSFVARLPDFPTLNATFPSLARELLSLTAASSVDSMQLAPQVGTAAWGCPSSAPVRRWAVH